MSSEVVAYKLDDSTTVEFEIVPESGFRPAGSHDVPGRLAEAIGPAIAAAKMVLDKVIEARPDHIEVKFGLKASGSSNWLVAKGAAEGNFEVTLTWVRHDENRDGEE